MRGRLATIFVCCAAALLLLGAPAASAAAGLDPTFGQGGLSFSPSGTASGPYFPQLDIAPEGSTYVSSGGTSIVRFGPGGAWDSTFAGSGDLEEGQIDPTDGEIEFQPQATAVDSKGRLLVFGSELDNEETAPSDSTEGGELIESEAMVFRFDPDGALDPTFGEGKGFVRSTFGVKSAYGTVGALPVGFPMVRAIAGTVDSKDRPVVAVGGLEPVGGCYAKGGPDVEVRAVARLTEAGLPDPTFGKGGSVPTAGTTFLPYLGLVDGDLPIVDVGPTGGREPECRRGSTLIRLDEDGGRLASFGQAGTVHVQAFELALVEPSGATILTRSNHGLLELRRRGPKGRPDRSFGRDGLAKLPLPGARGAAVEPVAVDAEGRILTAGSIGVQEERSRHKGRSTIVVGRLLPDGRPDPSFGEGGWILTRLAPGVELEEGTAALDPGGRLLVPGVTRTSKEALAGYVLARYLLGP
jgi:uncharacterized delta-60 repeat protein